ncbi:hypothetical protein [Actinoplanes aureus]|uniref:Uncharacterized protein n=1 Tax=Actinoplanes aureus TaxID=2792083 RepID=A0A931G8D6_9ACTN|nr:hypothetical protein [Actinoplanes aureus]MBG0569144.1 hypothetical protein [Actinoplanes aureus]
MLAEPRRTATLLATARRLEAAAMDDALDLLDSLMATRLIGPARRVTDRARLEAMPRLEKASSTLMVVARKMLDLLDGVAGLAEHSPPADTGVHHERSARPATVAI